MLNLMILSNNLKKMLLKKDIGLSKLSKSTGVPLTTLSNWINGQSPKNISQVKAVANYFSLTVDDLVFGSGTFRKSKGFIDDFCEEDHHAGTYEVILRKIKQIV